MPNAFLVPMSKTSEWWEKDWLERHTYFLPRYDDSGRMLNEGHVLAAAPGIECLMRRTYKNAAEPAPAGEYDFVNYFECADEDVATFHQVCAALRDVGVQSRVEVRARGSDLARTACRNLARAIRMTTDVLVLPGANAR